MNWEKYINDLNFMGIKPGLDNIKKILNEFNNPQDKIKVIHVAGTNGKGTTCNFFYNVLLNLNFKVGLFTSPHIHKINDRIEINKNKIDDSSIDEIMTKLVYFENVLNIKLTKFEILTVLAFVYFEKSKVDYAVIEVGMGGRLDSTNVVKKPLVSVICNIGLDHTDFLGDTIEEISFEKAGIIKNNCPTVVYDLEQKSYEVIKKIAEKRNSRLYKADFSKIDIKDINLHRSIFDYKNFQNVEISMLGYSAIKNACVVLESFKNIFNFDFKEVLLGIKNTTLKNRFTLVKEKPTIIFDSSHNPQAVEAMIENINLYFENKKILFVLGVLKDKNYEEILNKVTNYAKRFYFCKPVNERALEPEILKNLLDKKVESDIFKSSELALKKAIDDSKEDEVIILFGSFYNY